MDVVFEIAEFSLTKSVASGGRQIGSGVNVYLDGHAFKLQLDAFHAFGADPLDGKQVVRAQIDASF